MMRDFKISTLNKPRVFANTVKINKEQSIYNKSIFTMCNYREKDKCPPWSVYSHQKYFTIIKKNSLL